MIDWLDEKQARAAGGLKWAAVDEGTLAAWVAEMDLAPPPSVAEALHEAVGRHAVLYPTQEWMTDLPERIADWHEGLLGQPVDPARILYAGDVLAAMRHAFRTLLEPGSEIVLTTPTYPPFFVAVDGEAMRQRRVSMLRQGRDFSLDLDGIEQAFARGARAIVLCNPHNPTGSAPTVDELRALAALAEEHDALVVADEVHLPLTHPGAEATPFSVAAPDAAHRTVTVTSGSKVYNLPGLRFAWMVPGDQELHRRLAEPSFIERGTWATPGVVATRAALGERAWVAELVADLSARHGLVYERLAPVLGEAAIARPLASFLSWVDMADTPIADDPARRLRDHGVRLEPGHRFGTEGDKHVRINVGAAEETLDAVLDRIVDAI